MTTFELRLKAADIVEQRGLAKYRLEDDDGHVCLLGALFCAATGNALAMLGMDKGDAIYRVVVSAAKEMGFSAADQPADWNNKPERTKREVIERLRYGATFKGDESKFLVSARQFAREVVGA